MQALLQLFDLTPRFPCADGMLIYRLLGEDAESSFARSWGISYGINAAAEWKDVAIEAAKAAVILAILERLFLTSNASWLEARANRKLSTAACALTALSRDRCRTTSTTSACRLCCSRIRG